MSVLSHLEQRDQQKVQDAALKLLLHQPRKLEKQCYCGKCDSEIHWITTINGKKMPCEITLVYGDGKKTLVTHDGHVIAKAAQTLQGYEPHWGFCGKGGAA